MSELSHLGAFRLIYKRRRTGAEESMLHGHLQHCAECRQDAQMAGLFTDNLVLKTLPTRPSPQFTAVYREQAARRSRRSHIMKPIHAVGGAVALALFMLAGWFIIRSNIQTTGLVEAPELPAISVSKPQAALDDQLIEAVKEKDVAAAEQLLQAGAGAGTVDTSGNPALYYAIIAMEAGGNIDMVAILLNNGADPDVLDSTGKAPLALATKNGHLKVVQLLLDAGADANTKFAIGNASGTDKSPLFEAATNNHGEIVELLIANGADVNQVESGDGISALHSAAYGNNTDIVKTLLDHGADIDLQSKGGGTPLHSAAYLGSSIEAVQMLLEAGAEVDATNDEGLTPMMIMIKNGRLGRMTSLMTTLLENGADPNLQDNNGDTVLHHTARTGKIEAIPILIEHGVDVNVQNNEGQTALDIAANDQTAELLREAGATVESPAETSELDEELITAVEADNAAAVESLINGGADVDALDSSGDPILKSAIAQRGQQGSRIVSLLLENGADVNALDSHGYALLPIAAEEGKLEIVQMLLNAGADVDGTYTGIGTNSTALIAAAYKDHLEIVELLIANGANVNHVETGVEYTPLGMAAYNNNYEIVEVLLESGADHTLRNIVWHRQTPLHVAVRMNAVEAVQALLDGGADFDARTDAGQTPLIHLMSEGYRLALIELATLLLDRGANPDQQDDTGSSAMHYAASRGIDEGIPILIEYGADVNLQNNEGQTPLAIAKNDQIAEMLREAGAAE